MLRMQDVSPLQRQLGGGIALPTKAADHPLAHKDGPRLLVAILTYQGDMCPKCGHGTRVTSKRWARCKKCGERVRRRDLPETTVKDEDE